MKSKPKNAPPQPEPSESDLAVKQHMKALGLIALVWFVIFLFCVIQKAAELRVMMPVITLVFMAYLVYATISVLIALKSDKTKK